jgi:hypothetical protein
MGTATLAISLCAHLLALVNTIQLVILLALYVRSASATLL